MTMRLVFTKPAGLKSNQSTRTGTGFIVTNVLFVSNEQSNLEAMSLARSMCRSNNLASKVTPVDRIGSREFEELLASTIMLDVYVVV